MQRLARVSGSDDVGGDGESWYTGRRSEARFEATLRCGGDSVLATAFADVTVRDLTF